MDSLMPTSLFLLGNAQSCLLPMLGTPFRPNSNPPKLEFFDSVGISGTVLAQVICFNPYLLSKSLERGITPCYDIIKSLLLENFKVDLFFMSLWKTTATQVVSNIPPNISVLRALRVQEAAISSWLARWPIVMSLETDKFKENVNKVISMGVCPSSSSSNVFMKALYVISQVDAPEWAQKMVLYRKWGWTEDDLFLVAFRKDPRFMGLSEICFSSKMDFFVNRMGWQPADVAVYPIALTFSLEKWIIPRCSVIRVLQLKGLIAKGGFPVATILNTRKQKFLDRFVNKYQEQVPELLSIFQGKMGLAKLGLRFEE